MGKTFTILAALTREEKILTAMSAILNGPDTVLENPNVFLGPPILPLGKTIEASRWVSDHKLDLEELWQKRDDDNYDNARKKAEFYINKLPQLVEERRRSGFEGYTG